MGDDPTSCARCGRPIQQPRTGRPRRFCSASCRAKYSRDRRSLVRPLPAAVEPEPGWDRTMVQRARIGLIGRLLDRARTGEATSADFEAARRLLLDLEAGLTGSDASEERPADPLEEFRQRILRSIGES